MKKFLKKNKWLITLGVVLVGVFTGVDLTPVQKAFEESSNDSTIVQSRTSTDQLGDSIVNDSLCYTPNSDCYAK
jgi:hypothetical protein